MTTSIKILADLLAAILFIGLLWFLLFGFGGHVSGGLKYARVDRFQSQFESCYA